MNHFFWTLAQWLTLQKMKIPRQHIQALIINSTWTSLKSLVQKGGKSTSLKGILYGSGNCEKQISRKRRERMFGAYIATSLQKFRLKTRGTLKHNIQKLITEAELENLDSTD